MGSMGLGAMGTLSSISDNWRWPHLLPTGSKMLYGPFATAITAYGSHQCCPGIGSGHPFLNHCATYYGWGCAFKSAAAITRPRNPFLLFPFLDQDKGYFQQRSMFICHKVAEKYHLPFASTIVYSSASPWEPLC